MLQQILERKRADLDQLPAVETQRSRPVHDMVTSLTTRPLICEVKRRSPSHGDFPATDPARRAAMYAAAGAGAVSVLTDTPFFGGSFDDLRAVADTVPIPVLCKDFILDQRQVELAHGFGADAVLLIAAALTDEKLAELTVVACSFGLTILYEVHDEAELDRVLPLDPQLVGINSRNLNTMDVKLDTIHRLLPRIPDGILAVAESGIRTPDDVRSLREAGAGAFLVGTTLMTATDPSATIRELTGVAGGKPCS